MSRFFGDANKGGVASAVSPPDRINCNRVCGLFVQTPVVPLPQPLFVFPSPPERRPLTHKGVVATYVYWGLLHRLSVLGASETNGKKHIQVPGGPRAAGRARRSAVKRGKTVHVTHR